MIRSGGFLVAPIAAALARGASRGPGGSRPGWLILRAATPGPRRRYRRREGPSAGGPRLSAPGIAARAASQDDRTCSHPAPPGRARGLSVGLTLGAGTPPGGSQGRCTLQPPTLTRGSTSPPEAGLLTPGSTLPRAFPGPMSQWRRSGSLPGHSGATVPDSHRLPFSAAGSTSPAATSGTTQFVQRRHFARRVRRVQAPQEASPAARAGATAPTRRARASRRLRVTKTVTAETA